MAAFIKLTQRQTPNFRGGEVHIQRRHIVTFYEGHGWTGVLTTPGVCYEVTEPLQEAMDLYEAAWALHR